LEAFLKAEYLYIAVVGPFESRVLTHCIGGWRPFKSITVATGGPFESVAHTYYICYWGPF